MASAASAGPSRSSGGFPSRSSTPAIPDETESTAEDRAAENESPDHIDRELPIDLRDDSLRMLAGISVDNPLRRNAIEQAVPDILQKARVEVRGEPVDYEALVGDSPRNRNERRPKDT